MWVTVAWGFLVGEGDAPAGAGGLADADRLDVGRRRTGRHLAEPRVRDVVARVIGRADRLASPASIARRSASKPAVLAETIPGHPNVVRLERLLLAGAPGLDGAQSGIRVRPRRLVPLGDPVDGGEQLQPVR